MSAHENLIPPVLRCLLQRDPDTGRWDGHCLDLDLATSGKDPDKAWDNLLRVVRLHVEHCFTNWQDGLKFKAEPAEIAVFDELSKKQLVRREKITFHLVPPRTITELPPFWVEAAEMDGGALSARETASIQ